MIKKETFNEINCRIEEVHNHWIDVDNREIWIHSIEYGWADSDEMGIEPGVEYMMATRVIKNLHFLRHMSPRARVVIHLHTCGGMWEEGIAIYDAIMLMPYPVTIISYTHARSMSSIILQAADRRMLMPNSYFMFHRGTLATEGLTNQVENEVAFIKVADKAMMDIYINKIVNGKKFKGWSKAKIRRFLKDQMDKKVDVFLTAKEAVEWGFADGIVEKWPAPYRSTKKKTS